MGRFAVGNPIKGFPAGRSPAPNAQTITAPARRNGKRFDSLARVYALDGVVVRHAAISSKLRPRGPRAACGPPFSCFGLRPRRNGVGFRFLRKARKGLCPFHPHQPFEKGWWGWKGQSPFLALRRGRNTPNDTQRSGREVQQPGGLSDRGEPYQGVPRRTQSCKTASLPQPTPRAALPTRVPTIGTPSPRPFPFFEAPLALGEPLDRVPHPLLIFWEHWGISLSAESDQRRCLWNLPAF